MDHMFALTMEQKPSNKFYGPIYLDKEDIKMVFRDIIMTTNLDKIKKGLAKNEFTKDFFMIERIAKLLVSSSEIVNIHISKEIMIKLLRPMFGSNIVIRKHYIGNKMELIVHNEKLRSQLSQS